MKLSKLSLTAILGLTSCVSDSPNNARQFYMPKESLSLSLAAHDPSNNSVINGAQLANNMPSLRQSIISSYFSKNRDPALEEQTLTAELGPLSFSKDSISVGLPLNLSLPLQIALPRFEIPINRTFITDYGERSDYSFREYDSFKDNWLNSEGYRINEGEPVPLNTVWKAIKPVIFNNVSFVREVSKAVSRPVSLLLGDESKIEYFMEDDHLGAKLKYGYKFGEDYDCRFDAQFQAIDDGQIGLFIGWSIKTGRRPPKDLFRNYYRSH